jgi:hypothetical protein
MPNFGPRGGSGGYEFDEVAPPGMEIGGLIIGYGTRRNVLAAFQVIWRNISNGGLQFGEQHGNFEVQDGAVKQLRVPLNGGEFIVEIIGRAGQFVDAIDQIETSTGTRFNGPFG